MRPRHRITLVVVAGVLGLLAAVQLVYFQRGLIPGDALVYLAAGERLNAGHDLYALSLGDRPVDIHPPYWTVPLVSPPPMAVIFRPLALLPGDAGAYVWWGLQLAALATSIGLLLRRRPLLTAAAIFVLLAPLVYEIGVGNVNSFLLLGSILTWRGFAQRADSRAGVASAAMATVKLTPTVLGWWLIVERRSRAVAAFAAAGLVIAVISVVGAGFATHVRYIELLFGDAVTPSPLSLGGMAAFLGAPWGVARLLAPVAVLIGISSVWLLRGQPGLAFDAAVVTMLAGSPAVSINWYVLLLALLAPAAWPLPRDREPVSGLDGTLRIPAPAVDDRLPTV